LYGPKFSALKDDTEWLNKVTKQIRKAGCTDSQLFSDASEALYAASPTAEAAYNLAAIFLRRETWDKAAEYLEKGIQMGKDSPELADMQYQLAYLNFQHFKNYQKSRSLALNAIEARPTWGRPYILIGNIYITVRDQVFTDDFERKTVFWAAVDKFIKAKSVDSEITDEANSLINSYSGYFPTNEECFFRTMKDGDQYRVGGWINESTTVRSRKL
ncbi:MAG: tetratricopeptide repeat protein, partial [Bacteroidales bacterium]